MPGKTADKRSRLMAEIVDVLNAGGMGTPRTQFAGEFLDILLGARQAQEADRVSDLIRQIQRRRDALLMESMRQQGIAGMVPPQLGGLAAQPQTGPLRRPGFSSFTFPGRDFSFADGGCTGCPPGKPCPNCQ